ncbi:MAG: deoxyribodipyrimidine photo-lyase/cryptochrome family protein, partial [Gammaproteobacteria bacterium]|nr:deoxyribodipyrimidine photo-lyase/cryptochrome family protein [Gammaproteobacteria bacterium]
ALGQPLVVRTGEAVAILRELCARHGIRRLFSHEETGNLWTYARDRRVGAWARAAGIEWRELPQSGVVRRLQSRDGWAARRERFVSAGLLPGPAALAPLPGIEPGRIPTAAELGLVPDVCPGRQQGGRRAALELLESFLTERGEDYRAAMASPVTGEQACSRLSPHLALGTLSVREAVDAVKAERAEWGIRTQGGRAGASGDRAEAAIARAWRASLKSFESRLAWRDHFMQKLEDEPAIETGCMHPATEGLRPREPDAARLAAWQRGETGIPFVDACMRYLAHTGWLNFRMRSMLMAVASYHLWLDWRATGPHLARLFTDYEPGIHWSQCQMQSGTTGINTLRIYNPVKQGLEQDPDGQFTRRWVPELAEVPDSFLQQPWLWPAAGRLLGTTYPAPIVDVAAAARAAREQMWALRKDGAFASEAARVARRHASRKDRQGHFVNDREGQTSRPAAADGKPKRRRSPRSGANDAQLGLDF